LVALVASACGGGGSTSTNSGQPNLFDPAQFNTNSISWLAANVNATGSPPSSPTGTLNITGSPDFAELMDPQGEYETTGFGITTLFARRLVYYAASSDLNKSNQIVPDVAQSMPTVSSDGKTYTYKLRSGVMWNTDPPRQVTSMDFENGLKRECDPVLQPDGNPGYYSAEIQGFKDFCDGYGALSATASPADRLAYVQNHSISGIQTPDDRTIVFTLTAPSVDFNNILAMPFAAAAPREEFNFIPLTPGNPIYSDGPYQVSGCTGTSTAANYNDCNGYDVGHTVTFDDNSVWTKSSDPIRHQYLQHIVVKVDVASAEEATQEVLAGTTDMGWGSASVIPPSLLAGFANFKDPRFGAYPSPGGSNPYLVFNVNSENNNGALTKVGVRQALEYAIDKVAINKIYGGPQFNQVLNQVIPPGAQGYQAFDPYPTPGNHGDPSKCKSLLAQAGYPNGLTLKEFYRAQGFHPNIFNEVKSDFAKCGVTVEGTPVTKGFYSSNGIGVHADTVAAGQAILAKGQWDITDVGWIADWFGPTNGRAFLPDILDGQAAFPGTDYGGYDNPQVDQLVTQAESTSDLSKANSLWHQADVLVMKDAPIIPWQTQLTPLVRSTRVHNALWDDFSQAFDLTQIWVTG
jgi:peptide/nickel transport system substrate-binding protein